LIPLNKVSRVDECINVLVLNSVNEILTYVLMIYLARKTYVTRASLYGIISSLFVIIEGIVKGRYVREENHKWFITMFTWLEIILFLIGYALIFFERVTVKNKAKFQKISRTVRFIKEVEDSKKKFDAIDYRHESIVESG
jgi:hypothetical protein